ncbi:hypothetical protein [Jatrophihabitans fulvus]
MSDQDDTTPATDAGPDTPARTNTSRTPAARRTARTTPRSADAATTADAPQESAAPAKKTAKKTAKKAPTKAAATRAAKKAPASTGVTAKGASTSPSTTRGASTSPSTTRARKTPATKATAASAAPDATTPDATTAPKAPETEAPETEAPETEAPETEAPEGEAAAAATSRPSVPPRTRSVTSRARRIGAAATTTSAAAAAGSSADDGTSAAGGDDETRPVALAKRRSGAAGSATAETAATRKPAKPAKRPSSAASRRTDSDDAADGPRRVSLPYWAAYVPAVALAVAAVVFASLVVVRLVGGDDGPDTTSNQARERVLAAAKTCVASLNSYRYDDIAATRATAKRCTTGALTGQYLTTVNTVIAKNAPRLKASQTVRIETGGIECVSPNGAQWDVLLYGQVNQTRTGVPDGRVDPFAAVATLTEKNGSWKVSRLRTVSGLGNDATATC